MTLSLRMKAMGNGNEMRHDLRMVVCGLELLTA